MYPNQANCQRLTVTSRSLCGPTCVAVMFRTYSLVLRPVLKMRSSLRRHLCSKTCILRSVPP
ncbi:hypothetical protein DPMN_074707 [Dreissena polymorpha]|uniref:Uncharacterized protein n=1 Tax=Dreissena polymorpha TaxID=45954 RepID=A0A9D3YI76_DREPO|nr:hypothetical protein DPMN_074707 [Dreissena polymorpha]